MTYHLDATVNRASHRVGKSTVVSFNVTGVAMAILVSAISMLGVAQLQRAIIVAWMDCLNRLRLTYIDTYIYYTFP